MLERRGRWFAAASTSLRLLVTCEERVPAEKRAMKSLSWAIFFSRWAFLRFEGGSESAFWPSPSRRIRRCR